MKKVLSILLVALFATACSDDDNKSNGIKNPYTGEVTGMWKTVGLAIDGDAVNLSCEVEMPVEENFLFDFKEDGTFDAYHNCDSEAGIYDSGTYTTTGNVLTLSMGGLTGKAHMIDNLDENQLGFRFSIGSDGLFYGYEFLVEEYGPVID